MIKNDLYLRILSEIDDISIIDTHEHIVGENIRMNQKIDLFYWFSHYASSDLVSSGMSGNTLLELRDTERPLDERWAKFSPFWDSVRISAYGRTLLLAAKDLFGIDDINENTYIELSNKISASNHEGWFDYVLKKRANIEISIQDQLFDYDPTPLENIDKRFFAPVFRIDKFITPGCRADLNDIEQKTGLSIHSLNDLLKAMDIAMEQAVELGTVGLKLGEAYRRSLYFEKTIRVDAERVFNKFCIYPVAISDFSQQSTVSWADAKPLQDYLLHHAIQRAEDLKLPVQIHTGLQEGNGNILTNSDPLLLVNLLVEYPKVKFDLFHGGYPYQSQMATLGKNFQNVFVDMCWLHIISPWVARQTLHEWLETVPVNKIFGFGGDYLFVEGAYAHSRIARNNITQVLTEKIEDGYMSEDEAVMAAKKLLRENAKDLFKL